MPTSTVMSASPEPWYRHRWPWLLMAGPVTVLIAGAITMWISFSGADALVVDDYYKQGKAINQDLRRDRVAASMGLSLIHPTMPAKDLRLVAVPDGDGNFSVALPLLERAVWQVQLEDAARTWRLHGSWAWPQQKNTDIQAVSDADRNAKGGG